MNLDDRVLLLVAQDSGFRPGGQREDRMRHRGDIRARRHIENIENEEIADRMALREQGGRHDHNASVQSLSAATDSFYRLPFRTFTDHFVRLPTHPADSFFRQPFRSIADRLAGSRRLRTFGDHFVHLPPDLRTFVDRPFVHPATKLRTFADGGTKYIPAASMRCTAYPQP